MVRGDGADRRAQRLDSLRKFIIEAERDHIPEKRVIANFILKQGLTRRTVQEMIEDILDTGLIQREGLYLVKGAELEES